ncbi:hypothetical protein F5146DRAFT_630957 [Armillaria mellea]|nr:hypothetical protein F5146DRAFT_630957 [Armillaria mellea]
MFRLSLPLSCFCLEEITLSLPFLSFFWRLRMAEGRPNALVTIFIIMHTFGWIGSSIILLTVLCSPKVSRYMTWFNLNFSWIVACLSFSFLFITGQLRKSDPDAGVCLVQAMAVSAAPTLTAGTTSAFVIYVRYNSSWAFCTQYYYPRIYDLVTFRVEKRLRAENQRSDLQHPTVSALSVPHHYFWPCPSRKRLSFPYLSFCSTDAFFFSALVSGTRNR